MRYRVNTALEHALILFHCIDNSVLIVPDASGRNNNNNNNTQDNVYSAVIMTKSFREFNRFI